MMNQEPTRLDPALSALITLQQRANPTTPSGQPTVAAKLSAQAGQGIAGAMPQQGGQQERGLPGIIASAQQAAPSVAQNAQQGQVNDMAQQVTQRMQQQQQPTGVTGLPANNMGFAEGGIIPYAEGGITEYESFPEGSLIRKVSKFLADREKNVSEWESRNSPKVKQTTSAEVDPAALARIEAGYMDRNRPVGLDHLLRQEALQQTAQAAPRQSAPRQSAPRQSAPMMPSTEYGAGLNLTPTGIASAFAGAPAASSSSPDIESMLANKAEMARLNKERPDFMAQQIAALDADKQARAAATTKQKDRQGFDALMAMFAGAAKGGMGGMGEATTAFNRGVATQENAAREASLLDAQMRIKLGEADHARKIGDIAGYMAADKDIAGIRDRLEQLKVQREGQGVQKYGYDTTASTADKDRASRERTAALDRNAADARAKLALVGKGKADAIRELTLQANTQGIKKEVEYAQSLIRAKSPEGAKRLAEATEKYNALASKLGLTTLEAKEVMPEVFSGTAAPAAGATNMPPEVAAAIAKYAKGS